jgi:hypothetical protein
MAIATLIDYTIVDSCYVYNCNDQYRQTCISHVRLEAVVDSVHLIVNQQHK